MDTAEPRKCTGICHLSVLCLCAALEDETFHIVDHRWCFSVSGYQHSVCLGKASRGRKAAQIPLLEQTSTVWTLRSDLLSSHKISYKQLNRQHHQRSTIPTYPLMKSLCQGIDSVVQDLARMKVGFQVQGNPMTASAEATAMAMLSLAASSSSNQATPASNVARRRRIPHHLTQARLHHRSRIPSLMLRQQ